MGYPGGLVGTREGRERGREWGGKTDRERRDGMREGKRKRNHTAKRAWERQGSRRATGGPKEEE